MVNAHVHFLEKKKVNQMKRKSNHDIHFIWACIAQCGFVSRSLDLIMAHEEISHSKKINKLRRKHYNHILSIKKKYK